MNSLSDMLMLSPLSLSPPPSVDQNRCEKRPWQCEASRQAHYDPKAGDEWPSNSLPAPETCDLELGNLEVHKRGRSLARASGSSGVSRRCFVSRLLFAVDLLSIRPQTNCEVPASRTKLVQFCRL